MVCRLGLCDGRLAYIVPVCFGYEPGVLWIHSASEGRKIGILKQNPRICFEFDETSGIVKSGNPCSWGMKYKSVIGLGRAEFGDDSREKAHDFSCIMNQYPDKESITIPEAALGNVCVIRIRITEMTGKVSGYRENS